MNSGEAHGWMFVDMVNGHLAEQVPDDWDKAWFAARGMDPDAVRTSYCPEYCGPCRALRDYWNTSRGRAEAQVYVQSLSKGNRNWTWCPGGVINWEEIEDRMANGFCPNHEE